MAIILRLQGLDVKAGAEDIRTFFDCLHIPDGGVYIVGGRLREAFIAFSTERDAQLAMRLTGSFLKGSRVTLYISSMKEMEHKLKSLLKKKKPSPTQRTVKKTKPDVNVLPVKAQGPNPSTANHPPATAQPLEPNTANLQQPDISNLLPSNAHSIDSSTAFLLGICTVLQGLQSSKQRESEEAEPRVDFTAANTTVVVSDQVMTTEQSLDLRPGYARVFGLPASATKEDICQFFTGLTVQETIINVELGLSHGCLVKFANMQDARDALLFNQSSLGPICVEVRGATEKMWDSALQECENALNVGESVKPKESLFRETTNHERKSTSAPQIKRKPLNQLPSRSQKKPRPDSDSMTPLSPSMEYVVMVSNLPTTMTKTEIKELFGCPSIAHKYVLHLLDKEGNRTDTAFLIFNRTEDYDYAINLNGCHVGSDAIQVSTITKEIMRDMMVKSSPRSLSMKKKRGQKRKYNAVETPEEAPSMKQDPTAQTCLFVRNMPADVHKYKIKRLFCKYELEDDDVTLLLDSDGKGTGEAVVQFKSQKHAVLAQRLHRRDFLGSKVLLTLINVKQKEDILGKEMFEEVEH